MSLILGIDPGLTGACAALDRDGHIHLLEDLPTMERGAGRVRREIDPAALSRLLQPIADDVGLAVVEYVASRPGQGVASVFSMGHSLGTITAVIATLKVPMTLVTPATWKRAVGLGRGKDLARTLAARLHPQVDLSRAKDHNAAEALLLARYGLTRFP